MTAGPSAIPVDGVYNLRDLGGLPVAGGRVRAGKIFRSDDLSELGRAGVAALARLNLGTVVDFRGIGETEAYPDRLPSGVRQAIRLPIEAGRVMGGYSDENLNFKKTMGMMVSVYRALAADFQDVYRRFFEILADESSAPVLFHCTARKDRTGFAAALFLLALGSDRETAMRDYMFSRECLREKYVLGRDFERELEPLYTVFPEYLESAFEVIDHEFGGVEEYLDVRLGVDRRRLVEMYVEG